MKNIYNFHVQGILIFMSVRVLQIAHQTQVLKVTQAFLSRIVSINMYTRGAYHLHGKHIPLKTLQIL